MGGIVNKAIIQQVTDVNYAVGCLLEEYARLGKLSQWWNKTFSSIVSSVTHLSLLEIFYLGFSFYLQLMFIDLLTKLRYL